jgi:Amt family ammonium transporter
MTRFGIVAVLLICTLLPMPAWAAVEGEAQFVFNTFGFLVWGALVMWMAAGFTMLEAGSVRTKNASVICLKNIGLYSIAGLAYYLIGFNIMYVGVEPGGWFGSLELLYGATPDEVALLGGEETATAAVVESGYSAMSCWFFQMVFVATTASIVSGKFRADGSVKATPPSNVPVVTLGVFILWLGWFGFNGGSQLALSGAFDAVAVSNIFSNTNLAAAAGVLAALSLSRPVLGRVDLFAGLNGALAGLVAITAAPDIVQHHWAVIIGAIGGMICLLSMKGFEMIKIDDVVGAVPVHLCTGIWGTLAVCIAAGGSLLVQIIGILAIGVFVFGVSMLLWFVIDRTLGLRVSKNVEALGQDVGELGIEAYPEFVMMPEED